MLLDWRPFWIGLDRSNWISLFAPELNLDRQSLDQIRKRPSSGLDWIESLIQLQSNPITSLACFFTDSEIAHIMSAIQSTICDGSYIAVTHDTQDGHEDEREKIAKVQEIYGDTSTPLMFRNHKEVSRIFQGLHLVEPGLVFLNEWRIELDLPAPVAVKWLYGGLAKKSSSPSTPA